RRSRRVRRAAHRALLRRELLALARTLAREVFEPRSRERGRRVGVVRTHTARATYVPRVERREPQARRSVARALEQDVAGAPRRGVQALGPDTVGHGATAKPFAQPGAARAASLRGQGSSAGSGREAHPATDGALGTRLGHYAPRGLPTGLRSGDRATTRAVG